MVERVDGVVATTEGETAYSYYYNDYYNDYDYDYYYYYYYCSSVPGKMVSLGMGVWLVCDQVVVCCMFVGGGRHSARLAGWRVMWWVAQRDY